MQFKYWDNGGSETLQHTWLYTLCYKYKTLSKPNIFHIKIRTILQSYTVHSTHTTQYYKVTQYAHYTILQSYTVRTLHNKSQYLGHLHVSKSNGPVDITTQHLFVAWKHCLYLNSFSTLTYMVISTIYTISSHKSIRLIQISDYAYKCKISIQFY